MIAVMENGMVAPRAGASSAGPGPGRRNEAFADLVVQELVPRIDAVYRTQADRAHRAIAGLSMGAGQAPQIGFGHTELFGYIGAFSGAGAVPRGWEQAVPKPLLVWLGVGGAEGERFRSGLKAVEAMQAAGIPAVGFETPDTAHEWQTWRKCLREFAPRLFR